jgi:hypothetical protein
MDIFSLYLSYRTLYKGIYRAYSLSISLWNAFTHANRHVLLIISGDRRDANPIQVLISRIFDLEKLYEFNSGTKLSGINRVI